MHKSTDRILTTMPAALMGKTSEKLRVNPRKSWYRNLAEVTTNGDYEVRYCRGLVGI